MSSRSDFYSYSARERDRRRDSDRDRDRDRRLPLSARDERDRASMESYAPRENSESRVQVDTSKMDIGQAGAELASLLRRLFDLMAERGRLTTKKDTDQKLHRRKEQDYNDMSGNAQFPGVADSFQRHEAAYRKTQDATEKQLAKLNDQIKSLTDTLPDRLVKAVPFSDIKTRQIIETVKGEMALQPAPDDRLEKLEKQFKMFAEDLTKVKQENETLRAQNVSYEAQATELATTLKTKCEQIQGLVDSQKAREQEITAFKERENEMAKEMSALRTQLNSLLVQIQSQKDEFMKSLPVSVDAASVQDLTTLKQRVDEHDNQLSSFDATEYTEAMEKLVAYPSWEALSCDLNKHNSAIQNLQKPAADTSNLQQNIEQHFMSVKETSETKFKEFSTKIVEACTSLIDDIKMKTVQVEKRVKDLEALDSSRVRSVDGVMPSALQAPSAGRVNEDESLSELKKHVEALRGEIKNVQNVQDQVAILRRQTDETRTAHEVMIHSLDSQFKNMTTIEMAQIIMDNMKRLPQSTIPLDIQNFHERLASLEEAQQAEAQHRAGYQQIEERLKREIVKVRPDRDSSLIREQFMTRKRPRVMESNGVENIHVGDG